MRKFIVLLSVLISACGGSSGSSGSSNSGVSTLAAPTQVNVVSSNSNS